MPEQDIVYQAIANHTRRTILTMLQAGPKGVTEIAGGFAVSQPAVSQQLQILLRASLVKAEVVGRERIYRIDPAALRPVQDWITHMVADPVGQVWALKGKRRVAKGE